MSTVLGLILAVALAWLAWLGLRAPRHGRHPDDPSAWNSARLVYAERLFRAPRVGLVARVDRAYLIGGEIELVELKTRPSGRVHTSDVIELSVQRVVVEEHTGRPVSRRGWVLLENPATGRRRAMTVMLFDEQEVLRLRDRRRYLDSGADHHDLADLRGPASGRACERCGQRARCTARLA
jgi:hypothetical protein